jgi:electron transport complex protein RnfG
MAEKLESNLKNMVLSLALISLVMSGALGMVYNLTKGPIEEANKAKEVAAVKEVLPPFDNDPLTTKQEVDGLTIYTGTLNGQIVGFAVKTYTEKGFSGRFDLMAGFKVDGSINNVSVLEQKETPGLGTKMKEDKFKNQFLGKNPNSYKMIVKKDGGEVDAITAATISSRAYCDAMQKAYDLVKKMGASADTLAGKGGAE